MARRVLFLLLLHYCHHVEAQTVVYVDADATGLSDGSSWANAFTDLQAALALSLQEQDSLQIWIAAGTYTPSQDGDRTASFELREGLEVYGGFNGTEATLDQRDWDLHETILSGDLGVLSDLTDNSFHVVRLVGAVVLSEQPRATVLDGVTVSGGYAGGTGAEGRGGGIFLERAKLRLANARIEDNYSSGQPSIWGGGRGAGVYCAKGDVAMHSVLVARNQTEPPPDLPHPYTRNGRGGGVYSAACTLAFQDVQFIDNVASEGGGLAVVEESSATLQDVVFLRNWTSRLNPLNGLYGGGLYVRSSAIDISATFFIENRAVHGGAISSGSSDVRIRTSGFVRNGAYLSGGAINDGGTNLELYRVRFEENMAGHPFNLGQPHPVGGGAITSTFSNHLVIETDFIRNGLVNSMPTGHGGAIEYHQTTAEHFGSRFYGNVARVNPEGETNGQRAAVGGALHASRGEILLVNTEFVGNAAQGGSLASGGAAYFFRSTTTFVNTYIGYNAVGGVAEDGEFRGGGVRFGTLSGGRFRNSILWGNTAEEHPQVSGAGGFWNSLVEGGCPEESGCTRLIAEDPRIVRSPNPGPDGTWGTLDDDYGDTRFQDTSPAIDAGLTSYLPPDTHDLDGDGDTQEPLPIDMDGLPRVLGNEVDLGAYESPFTVTLEPDAGVPTASSLAAAYPNPFRSATTLALDVTEAQVVTVEVFDVLGRRVATVHDGPLAVGSHRVVVEAGGLPAGVYVVRAEGETFRQTQRVTLVR